MLSYTQVQTLWVNKDIMISNSQRICKTRESNTFEMDFVFKCSLYAIERQLLSRNMRVNKTKKNNT